MAKMHTDTNANMTTDIRTQLINMGIINATTNLIQGNWFLNTAFYGNAEVTPYMMGVHNLINDKRHIFYFCTTHAHKNADHTPGVGSFQVKQSGTTNCGVYFIPGFSDSYVNGTISYQQGQSQNYVTDCTDTSTPFMSPLTGYANYPLGSASFTDGLAVAGGSFSYDFTEGMTTAEKANPQNYELFWIFDNEGEYPEPAPVPGEGLTLQLWKGFKKRKKSTKRPNIAGVIYNIFLKADTSILNPHFILRDTELNYNYCKFNGRYYWIDDTISLNNNMIELVCSVDPLATWKTDITSARAYIVRAAWSGQRKLLDDANPATEEVIIKHEKATNAVCASDAGNYWITTTSVDGVNLYQLTPAQFETFADALWDSSDTTPENIRLVMENIISVKRVPFTASGTPANFSLGNFYLKGGNGDSQNIPAPMQVTKIDFTTTQNDNSGAITIPFASADYGYTDETYLDHAPYCTALIYLPFVGVVPLDLDAFGTLRQVYVYWHLDRMATGITYTIRSAAAPDGRVLATYTGNFGTSVPISSNTYDQRGFVTSMLTTIGGVGAMVGGLSMGQGNMALGGLAALSAGVLGMQKSAEMHTQINGAMSSNLGFYIWDGYVHVITINKKPVNIDLDANKSICGLPAYKTNVLSGPGYVQTSGAQIEISGTDAEKDMVNSLLDSGIYIE